jgi:prevent-host-death family protein
MVSEVSAVAFRQNLGDMIARVQYKNDSIIINKSGKPVAALVDAELFLRIRKMWSRFEELTDKLAEGYADVPEEDGMAEVLDLVSEGRAGRGR